jgi:hypothetical protein
MSDAVEGLIAYCREGDRVCPLPPLWSRLWEMLPNRKRVGAGWQPPPPLNDTNAARRLMLARLAIPAIAGVQSRWNRLPPNLG